MTDLLGQQIQKVKGQFDTVVTQTDTDIQKLKDQIEKLIETASFFDKNWAGQWAAENFDVYFDPLRSLNIDLTENQIWNLLKSETSLEFEQIKDSLPPLTKKYRELRENTITELSILRGSSGYEQENELLDTIENFKWGIRPSEYVHQRQPSQLLVYDYSVINTGIKVPPHISVDSELISVFSILVSLQHFQEIHTRLLKQIELKLKLANQPTGEFENRVSTFVIPIIERFHQAASQLRNRHDNRTTLTIVDEYDVQDLLHCLLKVNFEDVRPEDAVPSYAGKNTRVDFLLKREKTIIEVKKTRNSLKDKEVGDQLILDVAHYKSHPDCKRLICFVYDPETLITNPRGLEDDLIRLSNDEMLVEVYIRP